MEVTFKKVETVPELIDAIRLRVDVFIKEQRFEVGREPDEDDKFSTHYVALDSGKIIATLRVLETAKGEYRIQRIAVEKEHRGKGIGSKLLEFAIKETQKLNPKKIWLKSQVQAEKFYEKNNFKATSEPHMSEGALHINMEYRGER